MDKKLGKREKRVAIAKDVLKQLRMGTYIAMSTYFMAESTRLASFSSRSSLSGEEVQDEVKKLESCNVCAIGAAFISGVRLFDGINGQSFDVHAGFRSKGAQSFFTITELQTMERWFENKYSSYMEYELYFKLGNMTRKQRMRIVFQSIIDNGGQVLGADLKARFERARVRS